MKLESRFLRIGLRLAALDSAMPWFEGPGDSEREFYFLSNGYPYKVVISEIYDEFSNGLAFSLIEDKTFPDDSPRSYQKFQDLIENGEEVVDDRAIWREAKTRAEREFPYQEFYEGHKEELQRELEENWEQMRDSTKQRYYDNDKDKYFKVALENEMVNKYERELAYRIDNIEEDIRNNEDLSKYTSVEPFYPSTVYAVTRGTGDPRKVLSTVVDIIKKAIPNWNYLYFSGDDQHYPVYMSIVKKLGSDLDVALVRQSRYNNGLEFYLVKTFEDLDNAVYDEGLASLAFSFSHGKAKSIGSKPLPAEFANMVSMAKQVNSESELLEKIGRGEHQILTDHPLEQATRRQIPLHWTPEQRDRARRFFRLNPEGDHGWLFDHLEGGEGAPSLGQRNYFRNLTPEDRARYALELQRLGYPASLVEQMLDDPGHRGLTPLDSRAPLNDRVPDAQGYVQESLWTPEHDNLWDRRVGNF